MMAFGVMTSPRGLREARAGTADVDVEVSRCRGGREALFSACGNFGDFEHFQPYYRLHFL